METRRDSGRLAWGVVLLVLGLVFLLSNFGYGWWFGWGRWWPLILIAIGVAMLYRREVPSPPSPAETPPGASPAGAPPGAPSPEVSPAATAPRRYPTGAIILIGLGLAFLLNDLIGGRALPALVLIAIGVALLLRERRPS